MPARGPAATAVVPGRFLPSPRREAGAGVRRDRHSSRGRDRWAVGGPVRIRDGRAPAKTLPRLISWTEDVDAGVRYFSGIARYLKTIDLTSELLGRDLRQFLDLGEVQKVARVRLNEDLLGVCWTHPFRVEVTGAVRPGANRLEVEVANTWSNRLTGDAVSDGTHFTHTNLRWDKATPLLRSGLLGPVRLVPAGLAELRLT